MHEQTERGSRTAERREADRRFAVGLARAFGGAVLFSLPLLMTMEMWWLGFYMDRGRLAFFMLLLLPVVILLDRFSGFQETSTLLEDAVDGVVAYGVGFAASAAVLVLFNVVNLSTPLVEWVGKVALQAVPAAFGAVLANSQLALDGEERGEQVTRYHEEMFLMAAGALFLAFNVAPTEEMVLIAYMSTGWHTLALTVASLLLSHGFVYAVDFRGSHAPAAQGPAWSLFLRFTVVGYAVSLLICAYVLWTFGRFDGGGWTTYVQMTVVLGFPASLGAAAARLIV